ncbi:hypothetical protein AB0D14_43775 [Streptomyces sp. NPDC048484]|uniref:hypothetical protein n=1 Tax=Streptomyces sp. NPDC048484 TaxID=3155146 RepID=UPI00341D4DFE
MLLFAAVCCAAPVGNAISSYVALKAGAQDDGGIAEGGSAADIPARMLAAYKKAVQQVGKHVPKCQGMRWPVLAGIAKVESNHGVGRNIADNGRPGRGPAGGAPRRDAPVRSPAGRDPDGQGRCRGGDAL